jgi:uncharacterized protein
MKKTILYAILLFLPMYLISQEPVSKEDIPNKEADSTAKYSPYANEELFKNIVSGDIGAIKRAIKNGGDVNAKVRDLTPLMIAAGAGNKDVVNVLLENNADVATKGDNGKTALTIALRKSNLPIADVLIGKGADINAKDDKGVTPLMWASYEGRLETVKFVIDKKAEINASNIRGKTALNYAKEKNFKEIIKLLTEAGAE